MFEGHKNNAFYWEKIKNSLFDFKGDFRPLKFDQEKLKHLIK